MYIMHYAKILRNMLKVVVGNKYHNVSIKEEKYVFYTLGRKKK